MAKPLRSPVAAGIPGVVSPLVSPGRLRCVVRDVDRERAFLTVAAAGDVAFVEHAAARLEVGAVEYGDRWAERGVAELLRELLEEAADVGAWSALALQALDLEPLEDRDRERIGAALEVAARQGARTHRLLAAMVAALEARGC